MKKKFTKIVICILYIVLISSFVTNIVHGTGNQFNISEFDNFNNPIQKSSNKISANVITVVRIIAVTIAIVMLLAVAMKYMTSAPGDRADIKKHAISYLIGAFIIFGVTGIIEFLIELSNVVDKHL